ncbi:hypothetical protein ASF61_18140 [Duganella sp. Leaf126]|uniref:hypothetical protein n=1 Tax=Duganella sp. Leaf126 TaxID=1736266 RepID=UPI0006F7A570|nr:hypothetical protein [Duganella sp. Leaf126]KQQ46325.1 hypothetical protein ASF61_18140 [Duganella sp. Leaf126]
MKPYQVVMGLALIGAAALLLFGDRTPSGAIVEPVAHRGAAAEASAAGARNHGSDTAGADGNAGAARGRGGSAAAAAGGTRAGEPGGRGVNAGARADVAIARLVPRAQLVGAAGDPGFGAGEGIFLGQNWNPPPPQPTAAERAAANAPPPPPMAPPVPYTYFGKAVQDGAWEVYLARGDKTYVARSQSVIDGAWRVDRIAPPLLTLTYLPLNQVQQINIGAID